MRFPAFLILLLALSAPARAEIEVAKSYFEDKTASLTINDIIAQQGSLEWTPSPEATSRFGPTKSRIWFRFFLPEPQKDENSPDEVLLLEIPNSYLRKIALYGVTDGQVTRQSAAGLAVPFSQRDSGMLKAATFTFRFLPPRDPGTEYFLSIESDFPLSLPFNLWRAKNFTYHQWAHSLFLGVFFGCLAMAALFNGFLAASLRSRLYMCYALFTASVSMAYLSHEGLSRLLLWPESTWWATREIYIFGGLGILCYTVFVRDFLESRRVAPWLDSLLCLITTLSSAGTVILLFKIYQPIGIWCQASVVLMNMTVLLIAIKALMSRVRAARFFFLSSLGFNLSVVLFQLQEANLIWIGAWLKNSTHVGFALEVTLLSFALADRIRQVNIELAHQKAAVVHSEKMSALGRLAGEISHEINNPLAIIHGNASLIGKSSADAQVKEFAATIEQTAKRISKIVKGMRALSRDSRNDPPLRTFLNPLVQDSFSLCAERAKSEGIKLELAKPEKDIYILCRSSEICQVLLNLLNNALDATEGVPAAWVKLEVKETPKMAEISISDSGPGVPVELRPRILDPFFTTKEPGKGMGLGLSISRSIVEAHGGKLWLDEKSANTRFVFTVPLSPEEA